MKTITWVDETNLLARFVQHIAPATCAPGERMGSAIAASQAAYTYACEHDMYMLAAILAHRLVKAHPLLDGNKRLALFAALGFLAINTVRCGLACDDADDLIVALAQDAITTSQFADALR